MLKPANPLPIEETNLAGIGSDEDKAAREAAARIEFHWNEGVVGSEPGVDIWRVENERTENDAPDFGIEPWPKGMYGQFHRGDSYIVLSTTKDPSGDKLLWDVHFWIGSESSQDEYGVAAYKAVELDDLLKGEAMQHREIEGRESQAFRQCFPRGITYLDGGIASGFRKVSEEEGSFADIRQLYRVYKKPGEKVTRCFQVPLECSSLHEGDAFMLDAGNVIYTWFGSSVSGFEKSKSASVAHNIKETRHGKCECILDVEDENEEFWELLGGKGEIRPAEGDKKDRSVLVEKKMYVLSDSDGAIKVKRVPLSKSGLVSDDVCIVDDGNDAYVWIGKGSTMHEKKQAMLITQRYLKAMGRNRTANVTRVREGQERRSQSFLQVF